MKHKLLLSGLLVLFPEVIILLILTRFTIIIKYIKLILALIAGIHLIFLLSMGFLCNAILCCCTDRFRDGRLIVKMLLWGIAAWAMYQAAKGSIRCFSDSVEKMPQRMIPSVDSIRHTVHRQLG